MKKDLFSLEGKNALVVGGHGGIGRAIAEAFVMYGADVSIASRNMEKLQEAKEYIKENYGKEVIKQNAYKVKAVDTVGAGDTFSGYFFASIINGLAPKDALDLASKASAISVTRPGAAPSIPSLKEVLHYKF